MASVRNFGFTVVEIMTIILILGLIAILAGPLFISLLKKYHLQQDVTNVERVIRLTMSEALLRGMAGQIVLNPEARTVIGEILENDGSSVLIEVYTLRETKFGRTSTTRSPWLQDASTGASTWDGNVIPISPNGHVASAGVVYLNDKGEEAALEILISGTVSIFYQRMGGAVWAN